MSVALQTVSAISINENINNTSLNSGAGNVFASSKNVETTIPPTGVTNQSFCAGSLPTVADLVATGTAIKWYDVPVGGIPLTPNTSLLDGTTYYATQTVGGNESINRLAVTVNINDPASPTGNVIQSFCSISSPTIADIIISGVNVMWYSSSIGGSLISSSTALVDGNTYYCSQTVAGCESTNRLAVTVNINGPASPTASSPQSFCAISNPKVSDLSVTGIVIKCYNSPSGGSPLPTNTTLADGTTYYASQTVAGCESSTRTAVTAVISPLLLVTLSSAVGTDNQTTCNNAAITNITYVTSNATGINNDGVSGSNGLPQGVSAHWASNVITISGTPTVSGTYNYSIPLTGGCGTENATGTITVTSNNTVTLTSAVGTNNQTKCINSAITNITYVTTNATGMVANGLPTGVNAHWASNVITISGTPTVSGTFNYSIVVTGGCGTVNATGTITVISLPTNSVIIGNATPGCFVTGEVYSVTNTPGSTYTWSVPTGTTITSGQGTNAITVAFGGENGNVSVFETNASGCVGTPVIKSILLVGCGINADFNADINVVCVGDTVTFIDNSTSTTLSTTYIWDFGAGGNPVSAHGKGPHKVVYSTSGAKNVSLHLSDEVSTTVFKSSYITVNPLLGSVIFTSGSSTICEFSTVTNYSATAANASTITYSVSPPSAGSINHSTGVMTWNPTFLGKTRIIATANGLCKSVTDSLEVTVNPILPVSVSILADQNPVCTGMVVTLSATPTNGGAAPTYQWQKNGISVGTNSATYSYTPSNGDVVMVEMISNASPCLSGSPASSNAVVVTVNTCTPTGVDEQTQINNNKNLMELYVSNHQLHIKNAPVGEKVNITTASGMPIYTGVITTDVQSVSLPHSGVYIVTIGNKSQKVAY